MPFVAAPEVGVNPWSGDRFPQDPGDPLLPGSDSVDLHRNFSLVSYNHWGNGDIDIWYLITW